jgi:hypothetical protein
MEFHVSNNKAQNTLFSCLLLVEFKRVGHFVMAHKIWSTLKGFHEGNDHVKTKLLEMYRQEYENFVQLAGETLISSRLSTRCVPTRHSVSYLETGYP